MLVEPDSFGWEMLSRIPERIAVPRVPLPRIVRVIDFSDWVVVPFGTWGVVILVVVVVSRFMGSRVLCVRMFTAF